MQLTQIVATVALFGGAFAKHGCITNNPSWKTYSKADALENLNAHYAAWQVARDTSVPYAYVLGESKICLRIKSGGFQEWVSNKQIADAVAYIYQDCCASGICNAGWAELHVKDGYKTFATMSHKDNDCTQI